MANCPFVGYSLCCERKDCSDCPIKEANVNVHYAYGGSPSVSRCDQCATWDGCQKVSIPLCELQSVKL